MSKCHNPYNRPYTQDGLTDLFINQNLSAQRIANRFSLPRYVIEADLKKYNIKKPKELARIVAKKSIDVNKLYQYYIVEDHTMLETAKYFGVGEQLISKHCRLNGFTKDRKELNLKMTIMIDKDKLYQYYIVENHSTEETADYFHVHERTIRRKLNEFDIRKPGDLQVKCSQNNQRKKYGDLFTRSEYYKENVLPKMMQNVRETCLKKYGVPCYFQTDGSIKQRKALYRYQGLRFDSSWELALYIYAVDHNEPIIREPVRLEYYINDKIHYYFPDFLYKNQLIEIKGNHLMKNGKLNSVFEKDSYKDASKQQCMEDNNVRIMNYDDIKFALQYVKQAYGSNHLRQFKVV